MGVDDAKLRSVLARALGKEVRVKYAGRGTAHLDMYSGGGAGERASTCVLMGVGVDCLGLAVKRMLSLRHRRSRA